MARPPLVPGSLTVSGQAFRPRLNTPHGRRRTNLYQAVRAGAYRSGRNSTADLDPTPTPAPADGGEARGSGHRVGCDRGGLLHE